MKKDNSTLRLKASLRRKALQLVKTPVVLETHAGYGAIYLECYTAVPTGIAIEKNEKKAEHLAEQRPTWCVYEADSVKALAGGLVNHMEINFVDIDPYGEPWPVLDALLDNWQSAPDVWVLVVNDGLRQKLKMSGGWNVGSLGKVVQKYGSAAMYKNYLEICQELVTEKAGKVGFNLSRWLGYYCGHAEQMTHYAALLTRNQ